MSAKLLSSLLFALEHQRHRLRKSPPDGVAMLQSKNVPKEGLRNCSKIESDNHQNNKMTFMGELSRFLRESDNPQEALDNFVEDFQDFVQQNFSKEHAALARDLTDEIKYQYMLILSSEHEKLLNCDFEHTETTESMTNFGFNDSASSWAQLGQDDSFSSLKEFENDWKRPAKREEYLDIFSLHYRMDESSIPNSKDLDIADIADGVTSSWGLLSLTDTISSWAGLDLSTHNDPVVD